MFNLCFCSLTRRKDFSFGSDHRTYSDYLAKKFAAKRFVNDSVLHEDFKAISLLLDAITLLLMRQLFDNFFSFQGPQTFC